MRWRRRLTIREQWPGRVACLLALLMLGTTACLPVPIPNHAPSRLARPAAPVSLIDDGVRLVRDPIPFKANVGQAGDGADYLLRLGNVQAVFDAGNVSYRLLDRQPVTEGDGDLDPCRPEPDHLPDAGSCGWTRSYLVRQQLVSAQATTPVESVPAETSINSLVGDVKQHRRDIPAFHQLTYPRAWPGVDVMYERSPHGLKSTYRLAPGADPDQVQLMWQGVTAARVDESGGLVLETRLGELREAAPVAWQDVDRRRVAVDVRWTVADSGLDDELVWGFSLGSYDERQPLVIDPEVRYFSYLGGSSSDSAYAIAVDGTGAAFIAGSTLSTNFNFGGSPGFDQSTPNSDAFVVKLASDGRSLVYGTFLGGPASDPLKAIAVDAGGAAYLAGWTESRTFGFGGAPGFDQAFHGVRDGYVLKLAADGRSLLYGSYLGGSATEYVEGIAVDEEGAAYVAGRTDSYNFNFGGAPGYDRSHNGGGDGLVVKLAPGGRSLVYGTYLGGYEEDFSGYVAVDQDGAAYVAGWVGSGGSSAPRDTIVTKLSSDGRSILYRTSFGNTGYDQARGIAIDPGGAAYVTGHSTTGAFASDGTPGFRKTFSGGRFDAYVVKLDPNGSAIYNTFLGGTGDDYGYGIAIDADGAAFVVGATTSDPFDFGGASGLDQSYGGASFSRLGDAFLVRVASDGTSLTYGRYIGGGGDEEAYAVALNRTGMPYVIGRTSSTSFDLGATPGFDQNHNGGTMDGFVVALDSVPAPIQTATSTGTTATPTATATNTPTATTTSTPTATSTQTSTPTATSTAVASTFAPIRVNSGGRAFTDSVGNTWAAATGCAGGWSQAGTAPIAGTSDDALYQDVRLGVSACGYVVPNGTYVVTLKLVETIKTAANQRRFDVKIENQLVLDDIDIFALAGQNAALDRTVTATVADGKLDIGFTKVADNPVIAAIEIRAAEASGSTAIPTATATSPATPTAQACTPTYPPAQVLTPGQPKTGAICPAGQIDLYYFDGSAGQQVRVQMSGTSGSTPRPYLEIWDCCVGDGTRLAQSSAAEASIQMTLPATGRYAVRAGSFQQASAGGYSIALIVTTGAVVPEPAGPGAAIGGSVPTIDSLQPPYAWSAVDRATTYRIQVATNATFNAPTINTTTSTNSYAQPPWQNLARGTQYWWRVQVSGSTAWSTVFAFRTPTVPAIPTLTGPTNGATAGSLTPTLDWSDVPGATSYQVQVATNAWFGTKVVDVDVTDGSTYAVTSALAPNTTYYWRVNTSNGAGTSAFSATRSFKTPLQAEVENQGTSLAVRKLGGAAPSPQ